MAAATARAQLLSPGPLSKAHHQLEGDGQCQRCHASGAQVVEARCVDCHKDIGGQRASSTGLHGKVFRNDACATCHVEHLGEDVSLIRWPGKDPKRFDHSQTGFPLRGAHAREDCRECHDRKNTRGAPTFLGLDDSCASCHKDPHQKRFGERCTSCHDETTWKSVDLDGFDHALARFALDGAHEKVSCEGCHGKPAQYRNLDFADCKSCHDDPHNGRYQPACKTCHDDDGWNQIIMPRTSHPGLSLAAGHAKTECRACHDNGLSAAPSKGAACVSCHDPVHQAPFGQRCEECHASVKWTGLATSIGRNAHRLTAFPLRGEHGRTDCAECHKPEMPRAARYRSLEFDKCVSCHEDVHAGTLTEYGDCATCHDPLGFSPSLVEPALHTKFGFALEGSHQAAACVACHKNEGARRLKWEGPSETCESCHENPHGTQFALEMSSGGCAHCHGPQGWGLPNIDHSFWPLTGAHASAPCSGCHQPSAADKKTGTGASYKGAPRACEGCHDDVHAGQFRMSEPVHGCEHCHGTLQFALPFFDHEKLTAYPLEGKHKKVECASCHPGTKLNNGDEVTRYRLGYDRCGDCHADPHSGGSR